MRDFGVARPISLCLPTYELHGLPSICVALLYSIVSQPILFFFKIEWCYIRAAVEVAAAATSSSFLFSADNFIVFISLFCVKMCTQQCFCVPTYGPVCMAN